MQQTLTSFVRLCVFIGAVLLGAGASAQMEGSVYSATGRGGVATTFVTDYQSIGINPANLGFHKSFRDPRVTVGFFEMNGTFFTEALSRKDIFNTIFKSTSIQFDAQQKMAAADLIANTSWAANLDAMIAGVSVRLPHGFGIAFSVKDRIQLHARMNRTAAEIAFLGSAAGYFPQLLLSDGSVINNPRHPDYQDLPPLDEATYQRVVNGLFFNNEDAQRYSQLLDGSRISTSWFREANVSMGKKLVDSFNFSMYAGLGARYIAGIMLIELAAQNGQLIGSNISVSEDFGLTFGDSVNVTNPTFRPTTSASILNRLAFPNPVGRGFGWDFGITLVIRRNFYLGASVTNVGSIQWNGNVYQLTDGQLVQFAGAGLNNYNILLNDPNSFQFAGSKSPLAWEGSSSIRQELPSVYRIGASYEHFRTLHIGFDIVVPRNQVAGNLERPLYALGGDLRISKVVKLSSGFNYGGNNGAKINFPIGVTYMARKGFYEMGVSTRDVTTYFANLGGSTLSLAGGFMRLKI